MDLIDISITQAMGNTMIKQKKMMVACRRRVDDLTRRRGWGALSAILGLLSESMD
jgi:hypothetical protein